MVMNKKAFQYGACFPLADCTCIGSHQMSTLCSVLTCTTLNRSPVLGTRCHQQNEGSQVNKFEQISKGKGITVWWDPMHHDQYMGPPSHCEQPARQDWKYYLSANSSPAGKNQAAWLHVYKYVVVSFSWSLFYVNGYMDWTHVREINFICYMFKHYILRWSSLFQEYKIHRLFFQYFILYRDHSLLEEELFNFTFCVSVRKRIYKRSREREVPLNEPHNPDLSSICRVFSKMEQKSLKLQYCYPCPFWLRGNISVSHTSRRFQSYFLIINIFCYRIQFNCLRKKTVVGTSNLTC